MNAQLTYRHMINRPELTSSRLSELHQEAARYRLARSLRGNSRNPFRAAAARLLRRAADAIEPQPRRRRGMPAS